VTERRHHEPMPLGEGELPYSKGLLARALIATGVPVEPAYQLARRAEADLEERASGRCSSTGSRSLPGRCWVRRRASAPPFSYAGTGTSRRWTCR